MSVDVEGMDLKVLHSNDWIKFRPKMLLVEDNDHGLEDFKQSRIYLYVTSLGYHLCCITGPTMIFKDLKTNY
jgi:hypothetical protein